MCGGVLTKISWMLGQTEAGVQPFPEMLAQESWVSGADGGRRGGLPGTVLTQESWVSGQAEAGGDPFPERE